jgi:hypothetical protein
MLQLFHLDCKSRSGCCIYMHVASVCYKCFMCFIRTLQVFHLDVAYVCNDFQVFPRCFASVSDVCCKCFSCFRHMLQVFHLGDAKVDLVLHMLQWDLSVATTSYSCWVTFGWRVPTVGASPSGRKQACEQLSVGMRAHAVGREKTMGHRLHFSCVRGAVRRQCSGSDVRALASPFMICL